MCPSVESCPRKGTFVDVGIREALLRLPFRRRTGECPPARLLLPGGLPATHFEPSGASAGRREERLMRVLEKRLRRLEDQFGPADGRGSGT